MGVGIVRILYISGADSGGQGYLLAKAMRDNLGWDAKALTLQESYLKYETDWVLNKNVDEQEILDFAKGTNFFIMQDQYLAGGDLQKYINTRNSCIHGLGSPLRARLAANLVNQLRGHVLVVPPATDQTITPNLMASAMFESLIIDVDEIDKLTREIKKNSELTVCCAVTAKKQEFIEEARKQIEDLDVKFETISGKSWSDTIVAKARAHIILDPPSQYTAPGMNTWEAIYMGSIPVGPYGAWSHSIHPELEYYARSYNDEIRDNKNGTALYDAMKSAVETWGKSKIDGTTWIRNRYGASRVAQRWKWWITWAMRRRY